MRKIKKIVFKRRSLFKNDPFGIKEKYFFWRLKKHIRKNTEVRAKAIQVCVNIINDIGIPRNDESKELLRKAVKTYDDAIAELEQSVKYARVYIREDGC